MIPRLIGRAFVLLMLLAALVCTSAGADTRLMVATDLHYIDPVYFEGSDLLALSAAFGDGKMPQHSEAWLRALVAEAILQAPDALLLLGDLSYNGEVLSHKAISGALAEIEAVGIPVLVIPGNHDLNNDNAFAFLPDGYRAVHSLPPSRYAKYYGAFGHDLALSRDSASFSYAVRLGDVCVILLDAGIYEPFSEPFGLLTAETQGWLEGVLQQARADGAEILTVSHQSLLPHSSQVTGGYQIINGTEIAALLREAGVRLHLSGHIHIQHIAGQDGLYDIALSAFSSYPHQYALVDFCDDGAIDYATQAVQAEHLPQGLYAQSKAFFMEVTRGKALSTLQRSAADDDTKARMADYAAWLNLHYYAGSLSAVREAALADDALCLWQAYGADTFWAGYLQNILQGGAPDMATLSLPGRPK